MWAAPVNKKTKFTGPRVLGDEYNWENILANSNKIETPDAFESAPKDNS